MSKFNFGEWEAYLEYHPGMMGCFLYLQKRTDQGIMFVIESGKTKTIKKGEQFKIADQLHFAFFEDDQQLQVIADAISKRGIKDQNDHKNEGLLEATKYHLEDMRRIAFEPPLEVVRHEMSQKKLNGLVPGDSEANIGSSKKPTPVPTTILEDYVDADEYQMPELLRLLEDYYNTKYTTCLKKCIGEVESTASLGYWGDALKAVNTRNNFRAEILSKWEQADA